MKKYLFCLILLPFFFSCGSEGAGGKGSVAKQAFTENGNYEYYHHIKNKGKKPKAGDVVVVHYCMSNEKKQVHCTAWQKKPVEITFPDAKTKPITPTPMIEALRLMSAGDSLTIHYPLSLNENSPKPRGFEESTKVIYDIVVKEIRGTTNLTTKAREQ